MTSLAQQVRAYVDMVPGIIMAGRVADELDMSAESVARELRWLRGLGIIEVVRRDHGVPLYMRPLKPSMRARITGLLLSRPMTAPQIRAIYGSQGMVEFHALTGSGLLRRCRQVDDDDYPYYSLRKR